MASDAARRHAAQAGLAAAAVLLLAPVLTPSAAAAAAPWWRPLALRGEAVTAVSAAGQTILVRTGDGSSLRSDDFGATFTPIPGGVPVETPGSVQSGGDTWVIGSDGRVFHAAGGHALALDPGSPSLGTIGGLIAAPASVPGVVVAVAGDGTVWRRAQDGGWQRALLLLPAGFPHGVPRVTAVAAFTQPLSDTVYLATDGYAVLNSADGGDDWFRAGPGLPDSVYALATDPGRRWVLAGTSDGLWVHQLQALPAPPVYRDAALAGRWAGIVLVSVAAGALAAVLLRLAVRPRGAP
ncbi:MAG: hypothetical protein JOZ46_06845 [Candidatus Dormibacteraeota bacterium]|nr:hypothetical protein [Candidatus Dormibacteraeota bacterium]MBV9525514.1 hypothetical protein [Candidatus Dormibacteraeota bacterium]